MSNQILVTSLKNKKIFFLFLYLVHFTAFSNLKKTSRNFGKDSLQFLIDNYGKHTLNYDVIVNLIDQKSKDTKLIEDNLLALKNIKIEICKKITNPKLIKQFGNLVDSLVKEKEKINKKNLLAIDSLKKEVIKEDNLVDYSFNEIQNMLSKKQGSIHFTFKGSEFYFFVADLNKNDVRLHWKKDSIQKHSNLNSVIDLIKKKYKQKPLLVTNAGMFEESQKPLGLYIENNKEFVPLNEKDPNDDNFYLMPNGVFFIDTANHAFIKETKDFKKDYSKKMKSIKLATQSGPLLLNNNVIHKEFQKNSPNNKVRNGVGIINQSKIVFGYSDNVNFYLFTEIFKYFFNCKNALFLDGAISKMYLYDLRPNDLGGEFGPIISVSEKKSQ